MPPGPIHALRFVHLALRIQSTQIAVDARRLTVPAEAVGLANSVGVLVRAARGHAKGEDDGYFPTLEERAPRSTHSFRFDHEHEDASFDRLSKLVAECASEDDLVELKHLASVIAAQLDAHMTKEEKLLWPLTEELFSVAEQRDIIRAILGAIPPEDMPEIVVWITEVISPEDAVAYVETLQRAQPPEVFATTKSWIHGGVRPERWEHITARIPGLG